ncbi:MAG: single-stranded-DNA-specific exonuclease RecJ, partial [Cyanobacteria bacterium P01_D01_bin.128]
LSSARTDPVQTPSATPRSPQTEPLPLDVGVTQLDPKAIKQAVRQDLGDRVWYCLQAPSQKDCYRAYKQAELLRLESNDLNRADFSEAGLRLSFAVEREVVQPFFEALYEFSLTDGGPDIGGVSLGPGKTYTLGMMAPLIADQWQSFNSSALKQSAMPSPAQRYSPVTGKTGRWDRDRVQRFIDQWEHPLADWLIQEEDAASQIDQIGKLRNVAAHAEQPLKRWHYQRIKALIVGSETQPGLFKQLYAQ